MKESIEYTSKTLGECADDIEINTLAPNEQRFVLWTKILEDTITHLKYSIGCYNEFIILYLMSHKTFEKYKTFITFNLMNLCTAIAIDLGKLCHHNNDLALGKYIRYCNENIHIFLSSETEKILKSAENKLTKLKTIFEIKLKIVRDKIYGHNDNILFKQEQVAETVNDVSIEDLEKCLKLCKDIVSKIWYAYNNHRLCFTISGSTDYKNIIKVLCCQCAEEPFE